MFKSLFGFFNNQSVGEVFDDEIEVVLQEEMLNQSELQMLQQMMAQYIRTHEQVRKEFKEEALSYPVGDEMRNMLFREHREIKAKLKKLNLSEEMLSPDAVYEQYKTDPVLPWFPEDIKKKLEEVKAQKGE